MNEATQRVMFSSATIEYGTPRPLFDGLNILYGPFELDPASTDENAKCRSHFTIAEDGLKQDWTKYGKIFLNPPYGKTIHEWIAKAHSTAMKGSMVVCLLPVRSCTRWWHRYVVKGDILFIEGRLTFDGAEHPAPFPSAVVVFRGRRPAVSSFQLPPEISRMVCPPWVEDQLLFNFVA